jgi:2-polyprenyl-3-methyl-5-hydroxy-6-metoxy-1,4-benzoquinol methylase
MEITKEHYNCPMCGQDDTKTIFIKQGFSIVQCSSCEFVYVNPRIANSQLSQIYKHNYFNNHDYGYTGYEQEKRLRVKNFEEWLGISAKFLIGNNHVRALDVGCAAGYCLEVMKAKGWDAEGIELDEEMLATLHKKEFVVNANLLENFTSAHQFSIITLFDVVEHIAELDKAFAKLHDLVTDDGIIVIVTPDHGSLHRKIAGKKWFQYKPVEHIQYFTRQSLTLLAKRNNLELVYSASCGQFADSDFLINRLENYQFKMPAKVLKSLFRFFKIRNRYYYVDTGSLFAILKKA